jgi:hypothetical protein
MAKRPRPDLEQVREALRHRDERPEEPPPVEQPPADDDDEPDSDD